MNPVDGHQTEISKPLGQPQYLVVVPPASDESSIDMWALIGLLWKRGWVILTAALVVGGAVAAYVINQPNIYKASAVVAIRSGQDGMGADLARGGLGGLASLAGVKLDTGGGERDELIAALTSRTLAERFIREKQLVDELFWDERTADGRWTEDEPTIGEAVDRWLEETLIVAEERKTGLVSVSVEDIDRRRAAAWANAYVELANRTARTRQIQEASRAVEYLRQQVLVNSLEGVQQSLYHMIETNLNRIALAKVREDYPYSFIDRAMPPEPKKKVRPKRTLMVLIGAFGGAILAALVILIAGRRRILKRPPPFAPGARDDRSQQESA